MSLTMDRGLLDSATIDIPCPKCGEKTEKSLGWIKAHTHMICPNCEADIRLETAELRRELRKFDKALDDFRKLIK